MTQDNGDFPSQVGVVTSSQRPETRALPRLAFEEATLLKVSDSRVGGSCFPGLEGARQTLLLL